MCLLRILKEIHCCNESIQFHVKLILLGPILYLVTSLKRVSNLILQISDAKLSCITEEGSARGLRIVCIGLYMLSVKVDDKKKPNHNIMLNQKASLETMHQLIISHSSRTLQRLPPLYARYKDLLLSTALRKQSGGIGLSLL